MKIFAVSRTYGYKAGYEKSFIQYLIAFQKLSYDVEVFCDEINNIPKESSFPTRQMPGLCVDQGYFSRQALEKFIKIADHNKPEIIFLNHIEHPRLIEEVVKLPGISKMRYLALHDLYCLNGDKILHWADKPCSFSFGWHCIVNAYTNHCDSRRPDRLFGHFLGVRTSLESTRKMNQILVPSTFMEKVLVYNGVPKERISIIPTSCSIPEGGSVDHHYLLFVGRVAWQKGLSYLLESMTFLPDSIKLIVLGDGPERGSCQGLVRRLGMEKRVEFRGFVPIAEVSEYQRQCSLLVFPSVWEEPSGNVVIEAMAWGKPVVAFDVGGVSDFVKDGVNGFLVPRKEIKTLAEKILHLMKDEDLRKRMGTAARSFVQNKIGPSTFESRVKKVFEKVKT